MAFDPDAGLFSGSGQWVPQGNYNANAGLGGFLGSGAYSGLVGGASSLVSALMGGPKAAHIQGVHLDPATKGQDLFLEQGKNLPQVSQTIQAANDLSNDMFKANMAKFAPEAEQTNRQIGSNAAQLLAGEVPTAVGQGAGYNGRNLSARDLGLTMDDLMTSGVGMAGASLKGAQALNPFNTGSLNTLITPGALLKRDDAETYHNNDIANQQLQINSQGQGINPIMSGISGAISGIGGI